VAEDNKINQNLLARMFDKMGVQYIIVSHGGEVMEYLMNERFDMVLMDCYMSPVNGFETARKIRSADENFRNIPLLAFTASPSSQDRQSCLDSGMNDVILKPVTFDQLHAKLVEWAQRIFDMLPVLDETAIDKIRMFDDHESSLVKSLFQIYSENTHEELLQMKNLIDGDDLDGVRKKAHKLKSSAAQLGALRFEKYCDLMEYDRTLTRDRADKLFGEMFKEYEGSKNKFSAYCLNYSQSPNVLM
jgi:CheY-like chemotaxis protein